MTLPKPIFDPTITFGHMVQISLLVITILGGAIYVKAEIDNGKSAREKYIPIVEALVKSDGIQDERMSRLAEAVIEIRKAQGTLLEKVGDITTTLAVIEERTKKETPN